MSGSRGAFESTRIRSCAQRGQTIVLVTHDPDVAAAADIVLKMRDGRIIGEESEASRGAVDNVTAIGTL